MLTVIRSHGRGRPAPARLRGDGGSVLMLMPAAVFVVLVLGAIAVDLAVVHLAQRNLMDAAAGAANDAATFGLPPDAVRRGGPYDLDPRRAEEAVRRSLARHGKLDTLVDVHLDVERDVVTVVLHEPVGYIFAKAIPGSADGTAVDAVASPTALPR